MAAGQAVQTRHVLRKTPEDETAGKIEFMKNRLLYGCDCSQDVHKMQSLSKFLTVCPPEEVN